MIHKDKTKKHNDVEWGNILQSSVRYSAEVDS